MERLRNRNVNTNAEIIDAVGGVAAAAASGGPPIDTSSTAAAAAVAATAASFGATAVIVNRYKMERRQSQSQASRMVIYYKHICSQAI